MFGTASRRGNNGPKSPPAVDAAGATRSVPNPSEMRPTDHPEPVVAGAPDIGSPPRSSISHVPNNLPDGGRLSVGRDIRLTGELKSCESLIVEGVVNLELQNAKYLEVLEGGSFSGSAIVDSAEIAGTFDGDLTVAGLLIVHPTAKINGNITTSELQLERGGEYSGNLQVARKKNERSSTVTQMPTFTNLAEGKSNS